MQLTLVLTHACNLRCSYCYTGEKKAVRMPLAVGRRAIDFLMEQAPTEILLCFFGGEPFLEFPLMCELADYARGRARERDLPFTITVTTNGTLLTDEVIARIAAWPIRLVVSIDGVAEAHDTTRPAAGGGGSYAQVEAGLVRALRVWPDLRAILVVDPANVRWLDRSIPRLVGLGVRRFRLATNYFAAWTPEARDTYATALERVADQYLERFRTGDLVSVNVFDEMIRVHVQGGARAEDHCDLGLVEFAVAPSGNLYPCERMVGEDVDERARIGHVDRGFDANRRAAFGSARPSGAAELDACGLSACSLWCGCTNYLLTGDAGRVPEVFRWHMDLLGRASRRIGATLYAERNPLFLGVFYGETAAMEEAIAAGLSDRAGGTAASSPGR